MDRAGQDLGQHRQRVDAGIEDAEAAGLPDPGLAGMPAPHVLLPDDGDPVGSVRPASQALAGATAAAKRECQVAKSAAPAARAAATIVSTSPSVAAGGFSSSTSRPAASAFSAIAVRTAGGTQSDTAAVRPLGEEAVEIGEVGHALGTVSLRETAATRRKSRLGGDRRQVLVAGDLADADEGDRDDGRRETEDAPAMSVAFAGHGMAAAALEEIEVGAGVGALDVVVVELRVAAVGRFRRRRPGRQPARQALPRRCRDAGAAPRTSSAIMSPSRTTASGPPRAASGEVCRTTVP